MGTNSGHLPRYENGARKSWPAAIVMALFFLVGGKAGEYLTWQMPLLQAAAIVLLLPLWGPKRGVRSNELSVRWGCILLIALVAWQLIPLPAGLLSSLQPALVSEARDFAGAGGFYPPTTDLFATVRFLGYVLLGVALYAGLGRDHLRAADDWLLRGMIGVALVSLCVAATQVATGGTILDFWSSPHAQRGPGFFANRNHQALFLALSITAVWYLARTGGKQHKVIAGGATGLLILGIVVTGSRSGILLGAVLTVAAVSLFGLGAARYRAAMTTGIAALLAIGLFVLVSANQVAAHSLARFEFVDSDARWEFWPLSWQAAQAYFPLGSGFGTFVDAYAVFEPREALSPAFANHAHNDYLELLVEGGLAGVAGILLFLFALVSRMARALRKDALRGKDALVALGFMWLGAILLHSAVDYPVRTPAILMLFVWACVWVFRNGSSNGENRARKRHSEMSA